MNLSPCSGGSIRTWPRRHSLSPASARVASDFTLQWATQRPELLFWGKHDFWVFAKRDLQRPVKWRSMVRLITESKRVRRDVTSRKVCSRSSNTSAFPIRRVVIFWGRGGRGLLFFSLSFFSPPLLLTAECFARKSSLLCLVLNSPRQRVSWRRQRRRR